MCAAHVTHHSGYGLGALEGGACGSLVRTPHFTEEETTARETGASPHWAQTWRQRPLSKSSQVYKVNDFTHIYFCAENDFWFIQNKEEILNTTDMIWRVIIKGHLGLTSAPFSGSPPSSVTPWSGGPSRGLSRRLGVPWVGWVQNDGDSSHDQCGLGTWARLTGSHHLRELMFFLFLDRIHDSSKGERLAVTSPQSSCVRTSVVLRKSQSKLPRKKRKVKLSSPQYDTRNMVWLWIETTYLCWGVCGYICFVTSVLITPPLCSNFRCRAKRSN